MRQEKSLQNVVIVFLAIAVLVMSVGFATYTETLNINGTATFTAAKWDVRFKANSYQEAANSVQATSHNVGDKTVTYSVTLPNPNSTYSFTVDVQNYGTIDASLKKVTMTGLTEAQAAYITHTVAIGGTTYSQTTDNITGTVIQGGGSNTATVTVTVSYNLPANASSLPANDEEVTLNVSLDFVDANL